MRQIYLDLTNQHQLVGWGDIVKLMRDDSTRSMNRVEALVSKICSTNSIHDGKLVCKELASSKYNHDQPIFYRDICEKKILTNVSDILDENRRNL